MATETELRNPGGESHEEFDRDVDVRAIVYTGLGVAALAAVCFVLTWFFVVGLASYDERRDPEPSPIPEAHRPLQPFGPRLQATPERDLEEMRAIEEALLGGYATLDDGEHARVPIERAMEIVLERGLGTPAGAAGAAVPGGRVVGEVEESVPLPLEPGAEPVEGEEQELPESITPDTVEGPDGR